MNSEFKNYLLQVTHSGQCEELEQIQTLWSGYGMISRYQLHGGDIDTVVVKHIALNMANHHPRGWNTDIGHNRKVKSYQVETEWYKRWNQQCSESSRTAAFLGALEQGAEQWIILEDLDTEFPLRKHQLQLAEVKVCLSWLASFHAKFMGQKPVGLWEVGTYWHLDTRPEEFEKIELIELKRKAHHIDEALKGCKYLSLVHGDAKVANFCFSESGEQVAAVDFQYVGGGCGMKDVAYFLGSCLTEEECERYEQDLLDFYFKELRKALSNSTIDPVALETEWRAMFPLAWTDFTRFLLGWMPTHQKVNGYSLKVMKYVLATI